MPQLRLKYLWLEFISIFGGLPLIVYIVRDRGVMFAALWLGALLGLHALRHRNGSFDYRKEWNWPAARAGFRSVLQRFLPVAVLLTLFTVVHDGERLLSFPLERPHVWLMVMLLYPLLSVWPQEMLFRSFLMQRYTPIFSTSASLAVASAAAFGFAHIVFNNWIAVVFCLVGGWLFADTYRRHRSLALVCIEHALYGCFIFTIGLGWYFYGAAWRH